MQDTSIRTKTQHARELLYDKSILRTIHSRMIYPTVSTQYQVEEAEERKARSSDTRLSYVIAFPNIRHKIELSTFLWTGLIPAGSLKPVECR